MFSASFFKLFELFGKTGGAVRATARFRTDTYGKMVSQTVFEFRHVVIAALSCVVRSVKSHSDIETQYEEIEVATNAQSGA